MLKIELEFISTKKLLLICIFLSVNIKQWFQHACFPSWQEQCSDHRSDWEGRRRLERVQAQSGLSPLPLELDWSQRSNDCCIEQHKWNGKVTWQSIDNLIWSNLERFINEIHIKVKHFYKGRRKWNYFT